MEFDEVDVRCDQRRQKQQRIDNEHDAVADGKMRDAGRDQRDTESEVGEFPHFEGNPRDQERQHPERLGDGQFDSKVAGVAQVHERALHRAQRVCEIKVDGAERHHTADQPGADQIDGSFSCHRVAL